MKKFLLILLVGILLPGCASSPVAPAFSPSATQTLPPTATWTPTSTPTDTLTPTHTATPVPLSELDLGSLIYQPGDVPEMFIKVDLPGSSAYLVGSPVPDYIDYVNLRIPGTDDGIGIDLGLYEDKNTAQEAYQILSAGTEPTTIFGEQGFIRTEIINDEMFGIILFHNLAFIRCHAVVLMQMATFDWVDQAWSDPAILSGYAEKLDARLSQAACR